MFEVQLAEVADYVRVVRIRGHTSYGKLKVEPVVLSFTSAVSNMLLQVLVVLLEITSLPDLAPFAAHGRGGKALCGFIVLTGVTRAFRIWAREQRLVHRQAADFRISTAECGEDGERQNESPSSCRTNGSSP